MNKDSKSKNNKVFWIGNTITISNRAYAIKYNKYLDSIESTKKHYEENLVNEQIKEGKGPRPIVIIWSNKYHKSFLAVSTTTSKSKYNLEHSFFDKENNNFWKYEILNLNIATTKVYFNNKIWNRHSKEKIDSFLNSWSKDSLHKKGYEKIINLMNQYELESKEKLIKKLLKNQK